MYDKVDERKGNTKRKHTITAQLVPNHPADFSQGGGMPDIPLSAPLGHGLDSSWFMTSISSLECHQIPPHSEYMVDL